MKFEKPAYIPYLCCGYPTKEKIIEIAIELEKNGADVLELGIPFSDPIADGPTIQRASNIALNNCRGVEDVLEVVKELRKKDFKIPIIIMTYHNPIYRFGIEKFCIEAKKIGVDGIAVPDLPIEEIEELRENCLENEIELICFVALSTPKERIKKICEKTTGFVYLVAVKGITGERRELEGELENKIKEIKEICSLPAIVGFGISDLGQVKEVIEMGADGVIVGSKLITLYENRGIKGINEFSKEVEELVNLERI